MVELKPILEACFKLLVKQGLIELEFFVRNWNCPRKQ